MWMGLVINLLGHNYIKAVCTVCVMVFHLEKYVRFLFRIFLAAVFSNVSVDVDLCLLGAYGDS